MPILIYLITEGFYYLFYYLFLLLITEGLIFAVEIP